MRIVVTGSKGQLGTDLCRVLQDVEVIPLAHTDIEITDLESVRRVCHRYRPDVIINTVAYVRVDDCEDNRDKAFQVNALGARNIAVIAQELGAKIVQMSTDYVFGGSAPANSVVASEARQSPNSGYTEFDPPFPISIYGQSKLAGEDFVRHLCHRYFIVRGSGLFGTAGSSGKGGNFVETIIRLGKERPELRVVNDQIFSPTYTKDLAVKIAQLIATDYYGVFHVTNYGICSWYEFASEIIRLTGLSAKVIPITSDQYPQKAQRPGFSVLDNYHLRLLGLNDIRSWREALKDYLTAKKYI
jgi:dTDP-4-dehydrorhamnose reductase